MKKVLVMDFIDSAAKRFSFRVPDPKDDLSPDDVYEAMQALIAKDAFIRTLTTIERAFIVTTTEEQLVFGP